MKKSLLLLLLLTTISVKLFAKPDVQGMQVTEKTEQPVVTDPLSRILKNLCIDGTSPAYAESINLYLTSTAESNFAKDYTAKITYDKTDGGTT